MNILIKNLQYVYNYTILILQMNTVPKEQFCEALFDGKLCLLIVFTIIY